VKIPSNEIDAVMHNVWKLIINLRAIKLFGPVVSDYRIFKLL